MVKPVQQLLSQITGRPIPIPPPPPPKPIKMSAAQWKEAKLRLDRLFQELSAAGLVALPPDMEDASQLGQNPGFMMIYHRFMRISGHFRLL